MKEKQSNELPEKIIGESAMEVRMLMEEMVVKMHDNVEDEKIRQVLKSITKIWGKDICDRLQQILIQCDELRKSKEDNEEQSA